MSRLVPMLTLIVVMGELVPVDAGGPPAGQAGRVVEGRVLDAQGKPPREGRIMFGPVTPPIPFTEASTAALDAEGRYRIELTRFELESQAFPVVGALRYLAIAPGFRAESGRISPGPGPQTLDVRLTPEAWKTTEVGMVDRDGRPVAGAEVTLSLGGSLGPWARLSTDAEGRCQVSTAPGTGFAIAARREGYLPTRLGLRGTFDDPKSLKVPLWPLIRGRVVDPGGKPMAGIQVGKLIGPDQTSDEPGALDRTIVYRHFGTKGPAITDLDGRFTTDPLILLDTRTMSPSGEFRVATQTLCFADPAFRQIAFLGVDPRMVPPSVEVTLRPARPVRIPIEHEAAIPSGTLETWWELTYHPGAIRPGAGLAVMDGLVKAPRPDGDAKGGEWIEAYWHAGNYQINVHSADPGTGRGVEKTERDLVIPPGEGPLTLPTIRLTASSHHRLIGQPAPEIDAKDLDSGEPVRLADFRGKVIVLDFWGYWCGPCVGSMPQLAEVHRRFQGRPVVVLGLHDQSIQSREVYDRKLAGVKRNFWDGRELPFRVALDRPDPELAADATAPGNGVTCNRFDIHRFPTTLVIDRDGKVAGTVNALEHGKLGAMIEELLARETPRR